jgi:hypothetical protein
VVRATGRRPWSAAPAARDAELPGAALADLFVRARPRAFAGRASLTVAVENVRDVAWQSVAGYPTPGRVWSAGITIETRDDP